MTKSTINQLEQLKRYSTVVADTGDIDSIIKYKAYDATTNPSLLLKAAKSKRYQDYLESAVKYALTKSAKHQQCVSIAIDRFTVLLAKEIVKHIEGRVSIEIDPSTSFDIQSSVYKARQLIAQLEKEDICRERILIKIAATWEGIMAAKILETEGIQCNVTLVFHLYQAIAAADASAYLISPFVGRISDYYQQHPSTESDDTDPGVASVKRIYQYLKSQGYQTIVMAASFRNIKQIQALSGCDRLTISPSLLDELKHCKEALSQELTVNNLQASKVIKINEANFRLALNQCAMTSEKLAQGIRNFIQDQEKLKKYIATLM